MTDTLTVNTTYKAEDCVVRPGEGEKVDSGMVLKINAADMEGYFGMMEGCLKGKQLLAPHTHERETQAVYVINGELEFEVGGEGGLRFMAETGSYIIKPKGIEHAFWNAGDDPVNYIELSTGSNFEDFQRSTDQFNKHKVMKESITKHSMTIHIERIPEMLERHGLTSVSGLNLPESVDAVKALGAIKRAVDFIK